MRDYPRHQSHSYLGKYSFNNFIFSRKFISSLANVSESFSRLLITFANSLDPDQDQQNVCPGLDPNCLTL